MLRNLSWPTLEQLCKLVRLSMTCTGSSTNWQRHAAQSYSCNRSPERDVRQYSCRTEDSQTRSPPSPLESFEGLEPSSLPQETVQANILDTFISLVSSLHVWTKLFFFQQFNKKKIKKWKKRPVCNFLFIFCKPQNTSNGLPVDHECVKEKEECQNNWRVNWKIRQAYTHRSTFGYCVKLTKWATCSQQHSKTRHMRARSRQLIVTSQLCFVSKNWLTFCRRKQRCMVSKLQRRKVLLKCGQPPPPPSHGMHIYNAMHRSWVELLAVVNHSEAGEKTTTAF